MNKFFRDEFVTERSTFRNCSPLASTRCYAPEGGTTGKNSTTDQRQTQATSQEGQVVGSDGAINSGYQLFGAGSTITGANLTLTDANAVNKAFEFGSGLVEEVGKVLSGAASVTSSTVAANTAALKTYSDAIAAGAPAGVAESSNKTILYFGLGALALLAVVFFRR